MKVTYKLLSKWYDLIDVIYFTKKGNNPRKAILGQIPKGKVQIVDLCCGTMANSIEIAKNRKEAKVLGIDRSSQMLQIARTKIQRGEYNNVKIRQGNATKTGLPAHSVDIVILGLVLHEMETELAAKILKEAGRLLKEDGTLLVLEWERSNSLWKRLKFLPIAMIEPKPFRTFFPRKKEEYFRKHGYETKRHIACDYSAVYVLQRDGEEYMIEVNHIVKEFVSPKKYPGLKGAIKGLFSREKVVKRAVDDISFSIPEGEIVGYIGSNGAGKSTTIKMMTGILTPSSGIFK